MKRTTAVILTLLTVFTVIFLFSSCSENDSDKNPFNNYSFTADMSQRSGVIGNKVSTLTIWDMGESFYDVTRNEANDIFEFVDYVQLMQCSGGNEQRDLFVNPANFTVRDDYDFERLIKNCRGILSLGAKPYLKLGSVPVKYSSAYTEGMFSTNIFPPDDYNEYYNYMYALMASLVNEFGKEELASWKFAVMTEYENADWFRTPDSDADASAEAFFKLYDYTVKALTDAAGDNITVGAHAMAVTEGLWDEALLFEHCAEGVNYADGSAGAKLDFVNASFYDMKPGEYTSGKTLPDTIAYLRSSAEKYGFDKLTFGVDEGRIHSGNVSGKDDAQLLSRTCGYTYQAAYDARLYYECIENDIDYVASWQYLSGGIFSGNPTVSYHVANNISRFSGCKKLAVEKISSGKGKAEVNVCAGLDEESGTLRVMAYNFKNDVSYDKAASVSLKIKTDGITASKVNITAYTVNDDCNYFDEWCEDRKKYSITDDCFSWSPDDPVIESDTVLKDENARGIYFEQLRDKYKECSVLTPETSQAEITGGEITLNFNIGGNNVIFYEITPAV